MSVHTVFGFFYDNWQVFAETVEAEDGEQAAREALVRLEDRGPAGSVDPRVVAVVAGEPEDTYLFEYVLSLENLDDES